MSKLSLYKLQPIVFRWPWRKLEPEVLLQVFFDEEPYFIIHIRSTKKRQFDVIALPVKQVKLFERKIRQAAAQRTEYDPSHFYDELPLQKVRRGSDMLVKDVDGSFGFSPSVYTPQGWQFAQTKLESLRP